MMEKKRIIFDIDYTLLEPNYHREKAFFRQVTPHSGEYFFTHMGDILKDYESRYSFYNKDQLLWHLNQYSNVPLPPYFIEDWFQFNTDLDPQPMEEAKRVLAYLQEKEYEIVALTNWFKEPQEEKLRVVGIRSYFDEIYGGDTFLKPNPESYRVAMGKHKAEDCCIVGDDYLNDIQGAAFVGLDGIYLERKEEPKCSAPKIKRLGELKKYL